MLAFIRRGYRLLLLLLLVIGCNKEEPSYLVPRDDEVSINAPSVFSNDVLERAYQMANVRWTPLKNVPSYSGDDYPPGVSVRGIPYSSVKEINTYLFQDVSYHTFMTAVHNPFSVLYTEDISRFPYHGKNCATYYGAVCSSAVMYALGISIPYYANQIVSLPFMHRIDSQVADSLKICDVIWNPGHVQLVVGVDYCDNRLSKIRVFESAGRSAHVKEYLFEDFKAEWKKKNYVGYRYENICYSTDSFEISSFEPISYNDDLCPTKGDRSVYRTSDDVIISLLNHSYSNIVLQKDNRIITCGPCKGDSHCFWGLDPGVYTVSLLSDERQSDSVSFEVVNTIVNCSFVDNDSILVEFHSSVDAEYVCLCDLSGNSIYYPISEECSSKGAICLPLSDYSKRFCKVVFKGTYGRISSRPVELF